MQTAHFHVKFVLSKETQNAFINDFSSKKVFFLSPANMPLEFQRLIADKTAPSYFVLPNAP